MMNRSIPNTALVHLTLIIPLYLVLIVLHALADDHTHRFVNRVHYCCYDACLDACTNRAHHRQCPPPYTEQLYRDYLKRTAPTPEGDEDFGSFLTATPPGSNGAYRPPTTPDVATPSTSTTGQNMNPYPPSNKNKDVHFEKNMNLSRLSTTINNAAGYNKQHEGNASNQLPHWTTGKGHVPTLYVQVLEAVRCPTSQLINTNAVYALLVRSGLSRDTLARLWTLSNRHTPGQLTTGELYTVLAAVAVQQSLPQHPLTTLATLTQYRDQPPIPYLGQPSANATFPIAIQPLQQQQPQPQPQLLQQQQQQQQQPAQVAADGSSSNTLKQQPIATVIQCANGDRGIKQQQRQQQQSAPPQQHQQKQQQQQSPSQQRGEHHLSQHHQQPSHQQQQQQHQQPPQQQHQQPPQQQHQQPSQQQQHHHLPSQQQQSQMTFSTRVINTAANNLDVLIPPAPDTATSRHADTTSTTPAVRPPVAGTKVSGVEVTKNSPPLQPRVNVMDSPPYHTPRSRSTPLRGSAGHDLYRMTSSIVILAPSRVIPHSQVKARSCTEADDDFADFQSADVKNNDNSKIPEVQHKESKSDKNTSIDLIGPEDKYAALKIEMDMPDSIFGGTTQPEEVEPKEFASFSNAFEENEPATSDPTPNPEVDFFCPSQTNADAATTGVTSHHPLDEPSADDFGVGGDDFADFQVAAPSQPIDWSNMVNVSEVSSPEISRQRARAGSFSRSRGFEDSASETLSVEVIADRVTLVTSTSMDRASLSPDVELPPTFAVGGDDEEEDEDEEAAATGGGHHDDDEYVHNAEQSRLENELWSRIATKRGVSPTPEVDTPPASESSRNEAHSSQDLPSTSPPTPTVADTSTAAKENHNNHHNNHHSDDDDDDYDPFVVQYTDTLSATTNTTTPPPPPSATTTLTSDPTATESSVVDDRTSASLAATTSYDSCDGTTHQGLTMTASTTMNSSRSCASLDLKDDQSVKSFDSFTTKDNEVTHTEDNSIATLTVKEHATQQQQSSYDRYRDLSSAPLENDRHLFEWQTCVQSVITLLRNTIDLVDDIDDPAVRSQVIGGMREHMQCISLIYNVILRIRTSARSVVSMNDGLLDCISLTTQLWTQLSQIIDFQASIAEDESLTTLSDDSSDAQSLACGVCLLQTTDQCHVDVTLVTYAGRTYHSTCANFWLNMVTSTLPCLRIPELCP